MVSAHFLPMKTAAAIFPLLALLLFLPTAVVLYRRHGVLSQWRAVSLAGFFYYALTALCMTVVPLPKRTADMCAAYSAVAHPELTPGHTFADIWKEAHHSLSPGALVLNNPAVGGVVFNLILLFPLGVFLRYHFHRGFAATAALGFGTALFFEVTQGTGLWGLYACPYRLFDVDDLLTNTAGAVLGGLAVRPVSARLPALEVLDNRVRARRPVPFGRRALALVFDLAGVLLTAVLLALGGALPSCTEDYPYAWPCVLACGFWCVLLPWLTGATPGKRLLRLKLVAADGGAPALGRLLIRAAVVSAVALPLLVLTASGLGVVIFEYQALHSVLALRESVQQPDKAHVVRYYPLLMLLVTACGLAVGYGFRALRPGRESAHERLSGVRNVALEPTAVRSKTHTRAVPPLERAV